MGKNSDIKKVRKVLYDRDRIRRISAEMDSIVILMNLDPGEAIPPNDLRIISGAGPLWYVAATGAVNPAVLEAADRCENIAGILAKTRRELGDVKFDRSDKQHLQAALDQQVKGWRKRALIWRDPGRPNDSTADEISEHERKSLLEFKRVDKYLKGVDLR